jgi:methionyl-tRNA formyltransferase
MENNKIRTIFIGTSEFSKIILEGMINNNNLEIIGVVTAKDKPEGRKQVIIPSPIKKLSKKENLILLQPNKIIEAKEEIENLNPDLIILASYGQKIPKEILDIPKHGSLNIHPSLLPKYQGSTPIQSVILNGEKETGVSIILMSERIDEGPVLAQEKLILEKEDYLELENTLAKKGLKMFDNIIRDWIAGKIETKQQNKEESTLTKIIKKEDGRIDWNKSAEEIERKVRAYNPWPSVYSQIEGKMFKIWKAEFQDQKEQKQIGEIFLQNNKLAVQTGKGFLIIKELQLEGKKRTKSEDFLKGNNIIGKILN